MVELRFVKLNAVSFEPTNKYLKESFILCGCHFKDFTASNVIKTKVLAK